MKLWAGLGNPGAQYAGNRHNVGFMALDRIAADHGFGPWRKGFQGQMAEGRIGAERIVLLKPQTFMNLSGQSVGEAVRFHKIDPADVTVFHDELDLAPGRVRHKRGGGHAGHNGLRSIHAHIGEGYDRVRIGIGHPGHKDLVLHWVLRDFERDERDPKDGWVPKVLHALAEEAALLIEGGAKADEKYMSRVAHLAPPPDLPARLDIKGAQDSKE
jgi:PTH1 family peptidyl-tRNA hydrolase